MAGLAVVCVCGAVHEPHRHCRGQHMKWLCDWAHGAEAVCASSPGVYTCLYVQIKVCFRTVSFTNTGTKLLSPLNLNDFGAERLKNNPHRELAQVSSQQKLKHLFIKRLIHRFL